MNSNGEIFRWKNIALNTWVVKTPMGWILKSVDTKHGYLDNPPERTADNRGNLVGEEDNERITLAMSNSMINIVDPNHGWSFDGFRWFNIGRDTWRAKVSGGWVVKCVDMKNITIYEESQIAISTSMVFVPDATHSWNITKPVRRDREEEPQPA